MNPLTCILISSVLGVVGQLILKRAVTTLGPLQLRPEQLLDLVAALALNPLVILGLVVYTCGTAFWLVALSRVDLGYAYPFASLNYILVLAASWLLLGEQPSAIRLLGVGAICSGVFLISRSPARTASAAVRVVDSATVGISSGRSGIAPDGGSDR